MRRIGVLCYTHVNDLAELHERLQILDQDGGLSGNMQSITNIAQSIIGRIPRKVANYRRYHQSPFERTPPEQEGGGARRWTRKLQKMFAQTNPT